MDKTVTLQQKKAQAIFGLSKAERNNSDITTT